MLETCKPLEEANKKIDRIMDSLRNAEIALAETSAMLETEQAENKRLKKYVWHTEDCAVRQGLMLRARPDKNCDCGFLKILTKPCERWESEENE